MGHNDMEKLRIRMCVILAWLLKTKLSQQLSSRKQLHPTFWPHYCLTFICDLRVSCLSLSFSLPFAIRPVILTQLILSQVHIYLCCLSHDNLFHNSTCPPCWCNFGWEIHSLLSDYFLSLRHETALFWLSIPLSELWSLLFYKTLTRGLKIMQKCEFFSPYEFCISCPA